MHTQKLVFIYMEIKTNAHTKTQVNTMYSQLSECDDIYVLSNYDAINSCKQTVSF